MGRGLARVILPSKAEVMAVWVRLTSLLSVVKQGVRSLGRAHALYMASTSGEIDRAISRTRSVTAWSIP